MDKREALRSMLNNLIQDRETEASVDFHNYITAKMQNVAGLGQQEAPETTDVAADTESAKDD